MNDSRSQKPQRRWHHLTPVRFILGLLAVQIFLFLSEQFQWFPFNSHKGWTVLIAVGVVCVAVLVMLVWGLACLILRRRFQFSIQSLLLFLVVVSVSLGWFAWEAEKARRQREAVAAIQEARGVVFYDHQFLVFVTGKRKTTPSTRKWLRDLLGESFCANVEAVDLGRVRILSVPLVIDD